MNKKFSTLMAGVLLAASTGAFAQIAPTPTENGGFAKYVNEPTFTINNVEKGLVQLSVGDGGLVLAMEAQSDGTFKLKAVASNVASTVEVRNTLWTVVASGDGVSGYNYQLQNLGTGEYLAFNSNEATAYSDATTPVLPSSLKATILGAEVSSWTWLDTPSLKEGNMFTDKVALSSVFKSDSVLTMVGTTTLAADVEVVAVKYSNKNKPKSIGNQVTIVPASPAAFTLGINDLNSMLWRQDAKGGKLKMTFNPDVQGNKFDNLFSKNEYTVVPAVGFPAATGVATHPFGSSTDYSDLADAENAYQEALSQKAWIDALLGVCLTDGKIEGAKVTVATTALGLLESTTFAETTKEKLLDEIENITWPETDQATVVKAQVVDYINKYVVTDTKTLDDAAIAAVATTLSAFCTTNFVDEAAKATVEANIKKEFVEKATTGTTASKEALDDVKETAKETFADAAAENGWVSLMYVEADKEEDNTYLAVDQKFITTEGGHRDLGFKIGKFADAGYTEDANARLDLNGRYNFQFTYFPSEDSLVIRTAGWAKAKDGQAWKDMNTENTDLGADQVTEGNNIVKLTYLTDTHSEVTLGLEEKNNVETINTRISLLGAANVYVKTTLDEGVYFITSVTGLDKNKNGKHLIADFDGSDLVWKNEENSLKFAQVQDYDNMPRSQWVVEKNLGTTNNIYNREYTQFNAKRVQFYKGAADGQIFAITYGSNMGSLKKDTLTFTKIADTKANIGYKVLEYDDLAQNFFSLKYFNGLNEGNPVKVSDEKSLYVDPTEEAVATGFEFIPANMKDGKPVEEKYGYTGTIKDVKNLYRVAYKVLDRATGKYLKADNENGYVLEADKAKATTFYFKENNGYLNEETWVPYYALVQLNAKTTPEADQGTVAGVNHPEYVVTVENISVENSIGAFAFVDDMLNKYRRLGASVEDEFENMKTDTAKFFMATEPTRFLFENSANISADNGEACLNFLGVINRADRPANSALPIFIDTAYVRNNTLMPQYMLALAVDSVPAVADVPCPEHGMTCVHAKKGSKGYKTGRYLVCLDDSTSTYKQAKYQGNVRLGFVEAKHIEDTLVIASSKFTGTKEFKKDSIMLNKDRVLNAATFAFLRCDVADETGDFYIEARQNADKKAQYVRVHNGVPVLVADLDQAAKFNLVKTVGEAPTANEGIATSEVAVIAGEGQVTIANAAGKKVVISNILGQVVANTVLTSDNAVIAAPQGVVVVAVEGEEAVKAIVK